MACAPLADQDGDDDIFGDCNLDDDFDAAMGDADANPQQVPEAQPESDDSGFSEEDTNDFDNAFGDALDGEDIEGDTVGDVDAPLLRAAG